MQDIAFKPVVLRQPDHFSAEAVQRSAARLKDRQEAHLALG
jgi:hypothetical protein